MMGQGGKHQIKNRKKVDIRMRLVDPKHYEDQESCKLWHRLMEPIGLDLIQQKEEEVGKLLLSPIYFEGQNDIKLQENSSLSLSDLWPESTFKKVKKQSKKRQKNKATMKGMKGENSFQEQKIMDSGPSIFLNEMHNIPNFQQMKDENMQGHLSFEIFDNF